jgi:hypothetical protein
MKLGRSVGLPLLVLILASNGSPARGGDSAAESALKKKGLTKSGHTFVLEEAEKPVLEKMKEVRGVFATFAAAAEKQAAAEQMAMQSTQLEAQRVELQSNLNALNQQIAIQGTGMPNSSYGRGRYNVRPTAANNPVLAEKAQMTAALAEIGQTQKMLKSQMPQPKDKAALENDVKKKQEALKSALSDLRGQVDEVTRKYADLGADEAVKKPIDELVKSTMAKATLGPSVAFLAGVKELDRAERQFLGKRTPAASKKTAKSKK